MKIAIIGAGPAGLAAAYVLTKNNYKVDVYEADNKVGGLSASFTLWNQIVDIGPHRYFSNDNRVNKLWLEVVGDDFTMINRLTRILYKNKFFYYPIVLLNALFNLGIIEAMRCIFSYIKELTIPVKQDGSFECWVQGRFGKRLYEIFFKTYSEKLWGISCKQLDSDFASQRIKKLSLFEAIENAISFKKANKHATLVDRFAYPINGSGKVYQKMADFVINRGNSIFLNIEVKRVITDKLRITGIELPNGSSKKYDHVISSMPYTILIKNLVEAPDSIKRLASKLNYRNTIIVYLLINSTNTFPDNWIYVHSRELSIGRITNFRNWDSSLFGNESKTILALEFWCNLKDSLWETNDVDLVLIASSEMVRTGLILSESIEKGHVLRLNKSYPVYFKGYKSVLSPIEEFTNSISGLSVIGRNGSFKYNNQDHSILMGLLAAENIIEKKKHNLSKVNSDYTCYQESNKLSETGLLN